MSVFPTFLPPDAPADPVERARQKARVCAGLPDRVWEKPAQVERQRRAAFRRSGRPVRPRSRPHPSETRAARKAAPVA